MPFLIPKKRILGIQRLHPVEAVPGAECWAASTWFPGRPCAGRSRTSSHLVTLRPLTGRSGCDRITMLSQHPSLEAGTYLKKASSALPNVFNQIASSDATGDKNSLYKTASPIY